ncbi:hypothetical protein JOF47_002083 [Paeniglutamicibacter kerguelensis]|uniref:Uncharacterized protein n=1 Tax=Paeniglutamicibacter kerguelensis TaxID=254788 RepID=A0ABS4XDL7_9MICC|nr:hypothetical protein [Paeniglutamicibacter kerguelensis]
MLKSDVIWSLGGSIFIFAYLLWFTSSSMLESVMGAGLFLGIGVVISLLRGRKVQPKNE